MKAILIKSSLLFVVLCGVTGCQSNEFESIYSNFNAAIRNNNFEALTSQISQNGMKRLEYAFGDLSKESNQINLCSELQKTFNSPYMKEKNDSIIYVLSENPDGIKPINTLSFIRIGKTWVLDDYGQGK